MPHLKYWAFILVCGRPTPHAMKLVLHWVQFSIFHMFSYLFIYYCNPLCIWVKFLAENVGEVLNYCGNYQMNDISSSSFNVAIQEVLKWVTDQPAWKRSEGRDHILPVHHPWSFKSVRRFVKNAIWLLPDMDSTGNWWLFHSLICLELDRLLIVEVAGR